MRATPVQYGAKLAVPQVTQAIPKAATHLVLQRQKHIALRLTADEPKRVATFRLETEEIEFLKRMYYFAKRIAKLEDKQDKELPDKLLNDASRTALVRQDVGAGR